MSDMSKSNYYLCEKCNVLVVISERDNHIHPYFDNPSNHVDDNILPPTMLHIVVPVGIAACI